MIFKHILFAFALFAQAEILLSQDGLLDHSFDSDGMVTIDISNSNDVMKSIAVQADGKILLGGYTSDGITEKFCVIRLHANGSPDNNFGAGGIVITSFANSSAASDIAIQADGKIILAGRTWGGTQNEFALARYLPDGTLDPDFGNAGLIATSIQNYSSYATSVKVQPDGKILAGGVVFNASPDGSAFAIIRYHSNGTLDSSFGTGGTVTTDIAPGSGLGALDGLNDLEIHQDGKFVAAGFSGPNATLVKYNSNGSLDTDFGLNGVENHNFSTGGNSAFNDLEILENGKIIAAGFYTAANGFSDFLVTKHHVNGSLDNTFGSSGVLATSLSSEQDAATSVLVQNDGKILVGGSLKDPLFQFAVARFDEQGIPDATFGTNGVAKTAIHPDFNQLEAMALQADGNILAAGFVGDFPSDAGVVRYASTLASVNDPSSLFESIAVYPNPVTDELHLTYVLRTQSDITMELFNNQGQLMQRIEKSAAKDKNEETIQLSEFSSGIYYISIGVSDSKQVCKIVKR